MKALPCPPPLPCTFPAPSLLDMGINVLVCAREVRIHQHTQQRTALHPNINILEI